ncbi:cysteine hydrolase [Paenibacillus rhizovicinus]|uniref:Cysteine hydrolase n=1 Tax=Paenibacillus rhizovicinus TaxID=2704463 RepID=A0A6C0NUH9_9BACL|nr:isochorismatase family cysteine hydrolase [Paenibacillus rhizovicinus]QHW29874.1 cysteine hydrolase [Paenibacillus rhizovicinus]
MSYTEPHWHHSVLITIDTQNDFTLPGAPAEIPGTMDVIPAMVELLEAYRAQGLPIVHVVRLYEENGSNVDLCRRALIENGARVAAPESPGAQLVAELLPAGAGPMQSAALLRGELQPAGDREWIVYKPRWGAFYETGLDAFLRELNVDTVVFIGCNFPNCPRTSIYEASERDYRAVMVKDAMSQVYEKGIQELSAIGVNVLAKDEVLAILNDLN